MKELDKLKTEAAERRERPGDGTGIIMVTLGDISTRWHEAEAALDRAITLVELSDAAIAGSVDRAAIMQKERDAARTLTDELNAELIWWANNHGCCPRDPELLAAYEARDWK